MNAAWAEGVYNNRNRHIFDGLNFELGQLDSNLALPFLNQTNGTAAIGRSLRMTATSPIVAQRTSQATDCECEIARAATYATRIDYTLLAIRASNAVVNRHRTAAVRLTLLLADIPNLRTATFDSSITVGVERAAVATTSTSIETSMAALSWDGLDDVDATGRGRIAC